jgi:hypothetical protein
MMHGGYSVKLVNETSGYKKCGQSLE